MRDILFRGKRTDNGTWTSGYLFCVWESAYLCWGTKNNVPVMEEVIPKTVGQYTGLTDKNGRKIFEGDIVCHDFGEKQIGKQYAIVKWSEKYASFQLNPIDDWMFCNLSDVKVVGNIYDIPELIRNEV